MMKNSVFKVSVDTGKWAKAAGVRAVRTFAQSMASMVTAGAAISEIDWRYIVSVAAVSALYSILTSIVSIPEETKEGVR